MTGFLGKTGARAEDELELSWLADAVYLARIVPVRSNESVLVLSTSGPWRTVRMS